MRRILLLLLAATLFTACGVNDSSVEIELGELARFQPTIVLMHPTVNNLKTFISLTDNDVFPLPDNTRLLGVYHTDGAYNYGLSKSFLEGFGDEQFKLLAIDGELNPENLYTENDCSNAFREVFNNSRGIIFFGGPDMPATTYGNPTNLLTSITDPHRHYVELSFLYHLLGGLQNEDYKPLLESQPNYPIVGICLGMQSMNVATGGSMIQDIPTQMYGLKTVEEVLAQDENAQHRNYHSNYGTDNELTWGHFHQVKFEKGTLFDELNGDSKDLPYIWSSHHQALDKLGKDIVPIAWSLDGKIVEAITHSKYPNVLGVQFHPEVPSIYDIEVKIKRIPLETNPKSYIDLFPNEKGENFHRSLWRMVGDWCN